MTTDPPSAPFQTQAGRSDRVDAWRALGAFAIVCIHMSPLAKFHLRTAVAIDGLSRFGVPLFFGIAAYFYSLSLRKTDGAGAVSLLLRYARRLLLIYLVWSVFYLVYPGLIDIKSGLGHGMAASLEQIRDFGARLTAKPVQAILQGPSYHLWFLPSLTLTLALLTWAVRGKWVGLLAAISVPGFVAVVLAMGYQQTRIGLPVAWAELSRDLFLGIPFVVLGYVLSAKRPEASGGASGGVGWLLLVAGGVAQVVESEAINHFSGNPRLDATFSLLPFAAGAIMVALADPPAFGSSRVVKGLAWLGRISLGIYVLQFLAMDFVWVISGKFGSAGVWDAIGAPVVFGLAAVMTVVLVRVPGVNKVLK